MRLSNNTVVWEGTFTNGAPDEEVTEELPVEAEREPAAAAEDPLQDGEDKCRYF